jgi:hypothetical protein
LPGFAVPGLDAGESLLLIRPLHRGPAGVPAKDQREDIRVPWRASW